MTARPNAIRTTIVGGVVFMIPFVVLLAVGGKAHQVMQSVARPIADAIGVERVGMVAVIDLVTIVVTLGICYLAGLIATSAHGRKLYESLDSRLHDLFPRYSFIKAMASGLAKNSGQGSTLGVVLVRFDDQSQIGFEMERDHERVVVYLPGSPDPWSGAVSVVTSERVQTLDVDFNSAVKGMRLAGRGTLALVAHARDH